MAKLNKYSGTVQVADGLSPFGEDYPLLDAHYVQTREDGTRLDEEIEGLRNCHLKYAEANLNDIILEKFDAGENVVDKTQDYFQEGKRFRVKIKTSEFTTNGGSQAPNDSQFADIWDALTFTCLIDIVEKINSFKYKVNISEITTSYPDISAISATEGELDFSSASRTYPEEESEDTGYFTVLFNSTVTITVNGITETSNMVFKFQREFRNHDDYTDFELHAEVLVPVTEPTIIENELSATSINPVQNKVITAELNAIKESIKNSGVSITVDAELSETSTNPVQNKKITAEIQSLRELIDGVEEELQMINEGGVE